MPVIRDELPICQGLRKAPGYPSSRVNLGDSAQPPNYPLAGAPSDADPSDVLFDDARSRTAVKSGSKVARPGALVALTA